VIATLSTLATQAAKAATVAVHIIIVGGPFHCAGASSVANLFHTKRPQIGWTLLRCWSGDDQHDCSPRGLAPLGA
jgi:hypothetical protein